MNKGISKKMVNRMTAVLICIMLSGFVPVIGKVFYLQVIRHDFYEEKAITQQTKNISISPQRGIIYDRNMNVLAASATVESVYLSPNDIKSDEEREKIASGLSEILGIDKATLIEKVNKKSSSETIKTKIEKETADKVRQFVKDNKIGCVYLVEDTKRYYPFSSFASSVIGFVGTDNQGLAGIESQYDSYLKGVAGKLITTKNGVGKELPLGYERRIDPINGYNVVTTIDEVVQHFAEKHLETAILENKVVNRGVAIVMDVKTGEILAMANKPDFDLNQPFEITDPAVKAQLEKLTGDEQAKAKSDYLNGFLWRNKAISDTYEPGSVFKVLTTSMSLEEGVAKVTDTFYDPGYKIIGGRRVNCWKRQGHGSEVFPQGLQNSCNVVMMELSARVGPTKFLEYQKLFGLDEKTGIDLPGEASGQLHTIDQLSNPISLAVDSFGQTFKVTPIGLLTAIASVANGGKLLKPYTVKSIVDKNSNVVENFSPNERRQVISANTSRTITDILETVVTMGTGKNAYVKGYRVGGKTGTSEKIDSKNAEGQVNKYIASFVGVAPVNDPKVAVLVMLDEPTGGQTGGGAIAAPVVGQIMADIMPYLGVAPQYTEEELANMDISVPDVAGVEVAKAKNTIVSAKLNVKVVGSGAKVIEQIPRMGQKISKNSTVILYTDDTPIPKNITVPECIGMTAEQANKALTNAGLNVRVTGTNIKDSLAFVYRQSNAPGTQVERGTVITIDFKHKDVGD